MSGISISQMPDWTLIKDKDDNKYFIDKNGKIWTSEKPDFEYKAVSIEGLDYYLNQGVKLIQNHYKTEGLTLLKSIMIMPVMNNRIYEAQCRASKVINYLIKKEGARFKKLNDSASLLLYKEKELTALLNDKMGYSIRIPSEFKIINKKVRREIRYLYYGIKIALRLKDSEIVEKSNYRGYDLLLAIDSEKFSYPIRSVKRVEKNWRRILGADTFNRKIINTDNTGIVYTYEDKHPPYYSGLEGFYFKDNYGYFLRIISGKKIFTEYREMVVGILKSFKL